MREILFRGKRIDNGEWVTGNLLCLDCSEYRIATSCLCGEDPNLLNVCAYEVDPETVGEYTGLTDKHGRKIFDGDVVEFYDRGMEISVPVRQTNDGLWVAQGKRISWSLVPDEQNRCNVRVRSDLNGRL